MMRFSRGRSGYYGQFMASGGADPAGAGRRPRVRRGKGGLVRASSDGGQFLQTCVKTKYLVKSEG